MPVKKRKLTDGQIWFLVIALFVTFLFLAMGTDSNRQRIEIVEKLGLINFCDNHPDNFTYCKCKEEYLEWEKIDQKVSKVIGKICVEAIPK